jgi:protein arginine N-methyltransferase 1
LSFEIAEEHRRYLADEARLAAFRQALVQCVKPGDVVLDLGTGTGILGFIACEAGAKRVYSVDSKGMLLELARSVCSVNGLQNQMFFIKGLSTEVDLPEKVDIVVADQIGRFGFEARLLKYFSDARGRFLKQDGVLIPSSIDLWVAPVESPQTWGQIEFWDNSPAGFNFGPVRSWATNIGYPVTYAPEQLLAPPSLGASLDLSADTASPFRFQVQTTVERPGTLHGIGGWFSAKLCKDVAMTNSPLAARRIDRDNVLFPIDRPVEVEQGDQIDIGMHILPNDSMVSWQMHVWARPASQENGERKISKGVFTNSTWNAKLVWKEDVQRARPDFTPRLLPKAEVLLSVLKLFDAGKTLSEIEQEIYANHKQIFPRPGEAAAFVGDIVRQYSQ